MTLGPWLAAFVTVTALLSAFGPQLASLPLAARALVISGLVVTVMTRLALPGLKLVAHRLRTAPARRR